MDPVQKSSEAVTIPSLKRSFLDRILFVEPHRMAQ